MRITTSSGAAAAPIARTVMLYLLGLSRDIRGVLRDQAAHAWSPRPFDDIAGKVIGVVGMGPVGREVIRMAHSLGMHPIGMRRAVLGDEPCETWPLDRLRDLAAHADVLAFALPSTDETRGLVSADVVAAMKPGAVFVNVGRGDWSTRRHSSKRCRLGDSAGQGSTCSSPSPCHPTAPCGTCRTRREVLSAGCGRIGTNPADSSGGR